MKFKYDSYFLLLDGTEKQARNILRNARYEDPYLVYPAFPESQASRKTVWWAKASNLLNEFIKKENSDKIFFYGSQSFLKSFLNDINKRDGGETVIWSQWERTKNEGVIRFQHAIGLFMPSSVASNIENIETHLGNRFFVDMLAKVLQSKGYPFVRIGRQLPTPKEELAFKKGNEKITLGMIVKNEEKFISDCLDLALPYIDEIVICDTGSTDRTVEIAREYGARIVKHEWISDFAAARNVCLETIGSGWVLSLDADEYVTPDAGCWLKRLAERRENKVYYIRTYNYSSEFSPLLTNQANLRLFQCSSEVRFKGEIHEQLQSPNEKEFHLGPFIMHYGYMNNVFKDKGKAKRNMDILEKLTQGDAVPFDWFNAAMTYASDGESEKALETFQKYIEIENPQVLESRISTFWLAAKAALACGKKKLALDYALRGCTHKIPDAFFMKALVLEAMGNVNAALAAYKEAALLPDPSDTGTEAFNLIDHTIRLWRARVAAAMLLERERRLSEAEEEYRLALKNEKFNLYALTGLSRLKRKQGCIQEAKKWAVLSIENNPDSFESNVEYIEMLLSLGNLGDALRHIEKTRVSVELKLNLLIRVLSFAREQCDANIQIGIIEKILDLDVLENSTFASLKEDIENRSLDKALDLLFSLPVGVAIENERGRFFFAQRKFADAERCFGFVYEKSKDSGIYADFVQVLIVNGKIEETLKILEEYNDKYNEDSKLLNMLLLEARCFNSLARYNNALRLLNEIDIALLEKEDVFSISLIKGNSFLGLEKYDEAADCYFDAYDIDPDNAELLMRIGVMMTRLERWEDAEGAFSKVLNVQPENSEAKKMLEIITNVMKLSKDLE